jgi:hypothetical protein
VPVAPKGLPAITAIAAGGYHTLAVGPGGNIWFAEWYVGNIGVATVAGAITEYPLAHAAGATTAEPYQVVSGPGGKLWFASAEGVGFVTPTGAATFVTGPLGATSADSGITVCRATSGRLPQTRSIGRRRPVTRRLPNQLARGRRHGTTTSQSVQTETSGSRGLEVGRMTPTDRSGFSGRHHRPLRLTSGISSRGRTGTSGSPYPTLRPAARSRVAP